MTSEKIYDSSMLGLIQSKELQVNDTLSLHHTHTVSDLITEPRLVTRQRHTNSVRTKTIPSQPTEVYLQTTIREKEDTLRIRLYPESQTLSPSYCFMICIDYKGLDYAHQQHTNSVKSNKLHTAHYSPRIHTHDPNITHHPTHSLLRQSHC